MTPRRLSDLYVIGAPVVFDDGEGDPIEVWLQKISPLDHETALRRANLIRARVLARHADQSTDYEIARLEAEEMTAEDRISYLVMDAVSKKIPAYEAEASSEEPWSKDGYLQGLRDAWSDGLDERYQKDPEDPDALNVFNEMNKFMAIIEKRVEGEKVNLKREFEEKDEAWVLEQVTSKFLDGKADTAWLNEFRRAEIWLATREANNHRKHYFEKRDELDEVSQEVLVRLLNEYRALSVDATEGKDSAAQDSSSDLSESPENQETQTPSGLQAAEA